MPSSHRTEQSKGTGVILAVLAASQFLMTLDSSVMNVSISEVANDVHTTVTGVQTAITLYTLVMASLMITGGKIGSMIGRRRAFAIGLVVYAAGSATTAAAHSLPVLILGWSLLEGIGAALIMPAIVALVAGNVAPERRTAAYGSIAAAGAIAVAVGPLIGGAVTTFASWRYVFIGEVVIVGIILLFAKRIADAPVTERQQFDLIGAILSIIGLALIVLGVLKSGEWGWISAKPNEPTILNHSPVIWMLIVGVGVLGLLLLREQRLKRAKREPLVDPELLANRQMAGGAIMFFFQYLAQAGVFFTIPLFFSVVLAMSALATGIRIVPLSLALLLSALLVPRIFPKGSPRLLVRVGLLLLLAGTLVLIFGITPTAKADVVAIPMLLLGLGIGTMSSQLGAVTVSAVDESRSAEVGGIQNTAVNLGASVGTALAGAVLIASLSTALLGSLSNNPKLSAEVRQAATVQLTNNVAFVSDASLNKALNDAGVSPEESAVITKANSDARVGALDDALSVIAIIEVLALLCTVLIPRRPPGTRAPVD
jgi:EmrB/QacA subfamily drug resistance transporter